MNEQCAKVGEMAGRIYQILEKKGALTLEALSKESGLGDKALVNQAIGWLCREDKLHLEKKGTSTNLSLANAATHNCCK
ncbi:MAG TPA: winged helix-turn-helix domain-containing protein [Candidatus Omnitrophota bacterium]|nr:winged helix-turn-helix domain-containing protein [Candidatus Omnitrophota bacterium]